MLAVVGCTVLMIEIQCLKEYMLRMGIFALISHFAYCFAFGINMVPFSTGIFNQTSVMYPLFVAILVMWMFLFVAIYSAVSFLFVSKGYALVQIGVLRICIHGDISLLF